MNKVIAIAFLAMTILALQTEHIHQQAKTSPPLSNTTPTAPTTPAAGHPQTQPHVTPAPNNQQKPTPPQPHKPAPPKKVGHESEAGDPFGREANVKRTCF